MKTSPNSMLTAKKHQALKWVKRRSSGERCNYELKHGRSKLTVVEWWEEGDKHSKYEGMFERVGRRRDYGDILLSVPVPRRCRSLKQAQEYVEAAWLHWFGQVEGFQVALLDKWGFAKSCDWVPDHEGDVVTGKMLTDVLAK